MGIDWRSVLRGEVKPFKEPKTFRHGLKAVPVSKIASQSYCELKIDHEYTRGEVPSEEKDLGSEIHEAIFAMKKVETEDFIKHISAKKPSIATLTLLGEGGRLNIAGQPDAIVFRAGQPLWVIELKTTGGDPGRLWDSQRNQPFLYGLLLERMGFDCSGLKLAIVRARREPLEENEKEELLGIIANSLLSGTNPAVESSYRGNLKFHLMPSEIGKAEEIVAQAEGYWLEERGPLSAVYPGQCRVCPYGTECSQSLWRD